VIKGRSGVSKKDNKTQRRSSAETSGVTGVGLISGGVVIYLLYIKNE
jgi:hypothetical protein